MEAETNRLRAALFSSVTHDLRTPLASITASVTTLLEDESPLASEQRRELLEAVDHETQRLNRVIGNLMDLSRMRAGSGGADEDTRGDRRADRERESRAPGRSSSSTTSG